MASDNFLFNFSKLVKTTQSTSSMAQYSNTLPASQCSNGFPVDKYAGYGVKSSEVLYSIWNSYQSTLGAKFTQNQSNNSAPTPQENTMIGPKNIFIIRHGEKSASVEPTIQYHLNQNGIYRACQIPTLINQLNKIGYPISYIVTCNPCPWNTTDPSMRPQQTISMASFLLNIPMFIYGQSSDIDKTVDALFNDDVSNQFNGLNVLICWEHTAIQKLSIAIVDKCKSIGRSSMNADTFFAQPSVSSQTCSDGQYLAPSGSAFYNGNKASATYPYWNTNNYDHIYSFLSKSNNTDFNFKLSDQETFNCLTCYPNCELNIGLYQPTNNCGATQYYYSQDDNIESKCLLPTDWIYKEK